MKNDKKIIEDLNKKIEELEQRIEVFNRQFTDFIFNTKDAILITQVDSGLIIAANKSSLHLFQSAEDALAGSQRSVLNLSVSGMNHDNPDSPYETVVIRPDSTEVPVEVHTIRVTFKGRQCLMETFRDITLRKQEEADLQNALQHLKFHIENTPLAVVEFNSKHQVTLWSDKAAAMFGWTADEILGKSLFEMQWVHREDVQSVDSLIDDMIHKKKTSNINVNRNYRKDGRIITCEWYNSALLDSCGNLVSVQSLIQDITKREELEMKLKHSHNLMQYIIEHSRSAIAVHDKDLKYIYVSQRYLDEYRIKEKDIIGKHHYEIFPDLPQKWRDVHKLALEGQIISADNDPYQKADGTVEWTRWECRPWYNSDNSIGGIIIYTEVITRQKQAELDLIKAKELAEKSEERYRLFIEQTTEGIYRMDVKPPVRIDIPLEELVDYIYDNTCIVECNMALAKMYNASSRDEVLGKRLIDFHGDRNIPENRNEIRRFILEGFKTENAETQEIDVRGDIHYFVNSTLGIVENGFLTRIWGTQSDITEKQMYEFELLRAKEKAEESDRLKTAFLQNMSHEVRTPLNTIVGFAQLIAETNIADENLRAFADIISTSSDKLISIITDVIEISQIQTQQIKTVLSATDLIATVTKTVSTFRENAAKKKIELILNQDIPFNQSVIQTDSRKVEKILLHLLDNALKFTHKGKVEVKCSLQNKSFRIEVKDTGIGIAPEHQKLIFEPFRQLETELNRTYGGNGLGLAIVKAYVDLLKGNLQLKSQFNKGTTVIVNIPVVNNSAPAENGYADRNGNIMPPKTILIAEDDFSSYRYLYELLRNENFRILHARNGKEAVDICMKDDNISLILMDIKMPVMDGTAAARTIRSFRPGVPIIGQSAYILESEKNNHTDYFNDFISKPVNKIEFRQKVKKFTDTEQIS